LKVKVLRRPPGCNDLALYIFIDIEWLEEPWERGSAPRLRDAPSDHRRSGAACPCCGFVKRQALAARPANS
jgi:hypothetical protein